MSLFAGIYEYEGTITDLSEASELNLPSAEPHHQTPRQKAPVSPDEQVILSRGRRQVPRCFSPDRSEVSSPKLPVSTPLKLRKFSHNPSMTKVTPVLQRRRLDFGDAGEDEDILSSIPLIKKNLDSDVQTDEVIHILKKRKTEDSNNNKGLRDLNMMDPVVLARALSHSQLLLVLQQLSDVHVSQNLVRDVLPYPDVTEKTERLSFYVQNIYRSLPRNRLGKNNDSLSYNRAKIHLSMVKKVFLEDMSSLTGSCQWKAVMDYTVVAFDIVTLIPVFENPVHNSIRNECLRYLVGVIIKAEKLGAIDLDTRKKFLELMSSSSVSGIREVKFCRHQLSQKIEAHP